MKKSARTAQFSTGEADQILHALLRSAARLNDDARERLEIDEPFLDEVRVIGRALDLWGDYCIEATFHEAEAATKDTPPTP